MVRIDYLLFGYRKISVGTDQISNVSSLFIRHGIQASFTNDGKFTIRERDYQKIKQLFDGNIEYTASEVRGAYGIYKRTKNKIGILCGMFVGIILVLLSSNLVWDIRVEGNELLPDSSIIYTLSECGFSVGDFWSNIDRGNVESEFLAASDDVAWININRRGCVAYISVVEKERTEPSEPIAEKGYANIVATADCIIEELTVKNGIAVVSVGDVVKKGDLLISGILPSEYGGGFCRAEGSVIGRMSDTVSAVAEKNYEVKTEKKEKLDSINVKIFDFSINIFKRYRNSGELCDIIEDVKTFALFDKCKLPIEITKISTVEYQTEHATRSSTELAAIASQRMVRNLVSRLADADLLKINTTGCFTEFGYTMTSEIVFTAEIGTHLEFLVE